MAFPASQQTKAEALEQVSRIASSLKKSMQSYLTSINGTVDSALVLAIYTECSRARSGWATYLGTQGLAEYAKDQYADAGLDIVVEYQSMLSATTAILSWIAINIPKDGSGFAAIKRYNDDGTIDPRTFNNTALSPLVSLINNLINTIG
jgi:hypothetical protein